MCTGEIIYGEKGAQFGKVRKFKVGLEKIVHIEDDVVYFNKLAVSFIKCNESNGTRPKLHTIGC